MRATSSLRVFAAAAGLGVCLAGPAGAAQDVPRVPESVVGLRSLEFVPSETTEFAQAPPAPVAAAISRAFRPEPERPRALIPLYASLGVLQGLDIHSTRKALGNGTGREANPLMRAVTGNGAAFVAVKAAGSAAIVWAAERLWKRSPKTAVFLTAAANTLLAVVVARNYQIAGK